MYTRARYATPKMTDTAPVHMAVPCPAAISRGGLASAEAAGVVLGAGTVAAGLGVASAVADDACSGCCCARHVWLARTWRWARGRGGVET